MGYTGIDQIAQIQRSSSAELFTDYQYDPATGAPSEIKDSSSIGAAFTVQADRKYSHNPSGDVTGIATTGAAGTDYQCFNYDYLHDLTQAWTPTSGDCAATPTATTIGGAAPYWTTYTIDPATGNRSQVTHNPTNATGTATTDTYGYPSAGASHPHAVQAVTTTAAGGSISPYGYDARGNTTTRPGQTLTYDSDGKLSTVAAGADTQTRIYTASGVLLLQNDATDGTTLYLGDTELRAAPGSATITSVRTYSVGATPLAERSTAVGTSGSRLSWISGDANHTQDLTVDSTTGSIGRRYSDPYGNSRGTTTSPWINDHGYLNAATSAFSGLVQLGARAFDASIGKFLSVDAVLAPVNPQENNGYSYAANSPITQADPDGRCYRPNRGDAIDMTPNCSGGAGRPITKGINTIGAWGEKTIIDDHIVSSARYAQDSADAKARKSGWAPPTVAEKPRTADPTIPKVDGSCGAGYGYYSSGYINDQCVPSKVLQQKQKNEDSFMDGVGMVGNVAGVVGIFLPEADVVSYAAGGLAASYDCSNASRRGGQCVADGIGLAVPVVGGVAKSVVGTLSKTAAIKAGDAAQAFDLALNIVGLGQGLSSVLGGPGQ